MSTEDPTLDLLAYQAFPHLAEALQPRTDIIIQAWEIAVRVILPAADELTLQQLRNSLPLILQEISTHLLRINPALPKISLKTAKAMALRAFTKTTMSKS